MSLSVWFPLEALSPRTLTVVEPTPVRINDNLASDVAAAAASAGLPGQRRMGLGFKSTDLLGHGHRGEREGSKGKHCGYSGSSRGLNEMISVLRMMRKGKLSQKDHGEGDIYTGFP